MRAQRAALTLIEVMAALAVVALLLGGVAGLAVGTLESRRRLELAHRHQRRWSATVELLSADLRQVVRPTRARGRPLSVADVSGRPELAKGVFAPNSADGDAPSTPATLGAREVLRVLTTNGVDWTASGAPTGGAVWARWFLQPTSAAESALVREQWELTPVPATRAAGTWPDPGAGRRLDQLVLLEGVRELDWTARDVPTPPSRARAESLDAGLSRAPLVARYPTELELRCRRAGVTATAPLSEVTVRLALPTLAGEAIEVPR